MRRRSPRSARSAPSQRTSPVHREARLARLSLRSRTPKARWETRRQALDADRGHHERLFETNSGEPLYVDPRLEAPDHPGKEAGIDLRSPGSPRPARRHSGAGRPMGVLVLVAADPVNGDRAEMIRQLVPLGHAPSGRHDLAEVHPRRPSARSPTRSSSSRTTSSRAAAATRTWAPTTCCSAIGPRRTRTAWSGGSSDSATGSPSSRSPRRRDQRTSAMIDERAPAPNAFTHQGVGREKRPREKPEHEAAPDQPENARQRDALTRASLFSGSPAGRHCGSEARSFLDT